MSLASDPHWLYQNPETIEIRVPQATPKDLMDQKTLPETNSSHLNHKDGWKMKFPQKGAFSPIFRDYVSFREGSQHCFFLGFGNEFEMNVSGHPHLQQRLVSSLSSDWASTSGHP